MEITYLKKMQKTPRIGDKENRGATEEMINGLEAKLNVAFPISYREFLFLGGRRNNFLGMDGGFYKTKEDEPYYIEEQQQLAAAQLSEMGYKIEKPFWVIADLDGCEQFHYFHFDEGDNPPVYFYCSYMPQDDDTDKPEHEKIANSFSEYVENLIEHRKRVGF